MGYNLYKVVSNKDLEDTAASASEANTKGKPNNDTLLLTFLFGGTVAIRKLSLTLSSFVLPKFIDNRDPKQYLIIALHVERLAEIFDLHLIFSFPLFCDFLMPLCWNLVASLHGSLSNTNH